MMTMEEFCKKNDKNTQIAIWGIDYYSKLMCVNLLQEGFNVVCFINKKDNFIKKIPIIFNGNFNDKIDIVLSLSNLDMNMEYKKIILIDKKSITDKNISKEEMRLILIHVELFMEIGKLFKFKKLLFDSKEIIDIIKTVEEENFFWEILEIIKNSDFKSTIENLLNKKVEHLGIYPFTEFIQQHIDKLYDFKKVTLFDDYKRGKYGRFQVIEGKKVNEYNDIDCLLITTRDTKLKNKLLIKIKNNNKIDMFTLFSEKIIEAKDNINCHEVDNIIEKIKKSKKPIIFFGGRFYNNYTPILQQLQDSGYNIFLIHKSPEVSHVAKNPSYHLLPFKNKFILTLNQMLYFAKQIDTGILLMHTEGFLNPQFDGFKTFSSIVFVTIFLKNIKIPKILFLYDIVKPFLKNIEYETKYLTTYKEMLQSADKIVINSNTSETIEFLKNTLNLRQDMINFYRYNFFAENLQSTKLKDGFHIAVVSGFLNDVYDELRTVEEEIKYILSKEIHIHYYIKSPETLKFIDALSQHEKKYFHLEENIMNQKDLIYDISKYHAGWMIHNTQKIANIIANVNKQLFKDLVYMFKLTTVPSSILLYGVAGLPIFINRSMQGIQKEFPKEFFIPMELSEIKNIRKIIENIDWEERYKFCYENRGLFSIEENIDRLIKFLGKK